MARLLWLNELDRKMQEHERDQYEPYSPYTPKEDALEWLEQLKASLTEVDERKSA